jgi:hypothetical protein
MANVAACGTTLTREPAHPPDFGLFDGLPTAD